MCDLIGIKPSPNNGKFQQWFNFIINSSTDGISLWIIKKVSNITYLGLEPWHSSLRHQSEEERLWILNLTCQGSKQVETIINSF